MTFNQRNMLNKILKGIVDLLFRTKFIVKKFNDKNPDDKILVSDGSKMVKSKNTIDLAYGITWLTSERTVIMLNKSKLIFGNTEIPLKDIVESKLLKIKSMFIYGQVLIISTKDGFNYQFGMQLNPDWINQKTLPLKYEMGKIKYSFFSIAIRFFLFLYIIIFILNKFVDFY